MPIANGQYQHIVWDFEFYFFIEAESFAKRIFKFLNPSLLHRLLLIGIPADGPVSAENVLLLPLETEYQESAFVDVRDLADTLRERDPRRDASHSHPYAQQQHHVTTQRRSLVRAVEQTLKPIDDQIGVQSFVGYPVLKDGHLLFVVAQLLSEELDSAPRLKLDMTPANVSVDQSLIDAVIGELIQSCRYALESSEPENNQALSRLVVEDVLRRAGKSFVGRAATFTDSWEGATYLFDNLTAVSYLGYETAPARGQMIVCRDDHPGVNCSIEFLKPIKLGLHRGFRKSLELSEGDLHLLSNGDVVRGLGTYSGRYTATAEDLYEIVFQSHGTWGFFHNGIELMRVKYGVPQLPPPDIDLARLHEVLERRLAGITEEEKLNISRIVQIATEQPKGTTIIVTDGAESEAKRLMHASLGVKPHKLKPSELLQFSSIDGALLFDRAGFCHAIGVILDGQAVEEGDSARGARYNSTLRYIHSSVAGCVGIVVSEDGMVDVLPKLRPRIPKHVIPELLAELERIAGEPNIPLQRFYRCMRALRSVEFYMSHDDCQRANALWRTIDERISSGRDRRLKVDYEDFAPNDSIDDSYFI